MCQILVGLMYYPKPDPLMKLVLDSRFGQNEDRLELMINYGTRKQKKEKSFFSLPDLDSSDLEEAAI